VIPGEGYVRITAGNHFGKIAMHDAEASWKTRYLRCEEDVGGGLSEKLVSGRTALGTSIPRIR
jgi:hypothetical protein